MVLRVVVPVGAGAGLASLVAQSEPGWELGRHWEIVVVGSGVVEQRGLRALNAGPAPKRWTERAHACQAASAECDATWLLFTEADAMHMPGAVSRAIVEADRYGAGMLSYSPRRALTGLGVRAVMPLVLSELANAYPPAQVSDPERRLAFADSHFLLVRTDAYRQLGGYEAVAASPVPEVDLAFLAKRRKVALRYRYAPEAVVTQSPASFAALWQQWTPTLAVLIDNALLLALWRALDVALVIGLPLLAIHYSWYPVARLGFLLVWARTLWRIYRRVRKSNAETMDVALSIFGLPVFVVLLVVSWQQRSIRRL